MPSAVGFDSVPVAMPPIKAIIGSSDGWTFHGEVGSALAYSRQNQAVCLMPPGNLPFMQKWSVLAGAKSAAELTAIGKEIGITFT